MGTGRKIGVFAHAVERGVDTLWVGPESALNPLVVARFLPAKHGFRANLNEPQRMKFDRAIQLEPAGAGVSVSVNRDNIVKTGSK